MLQVFQGLFALASFVLAFVFVALFVSITAGIRVQLERMNENQFQLGKRLVETLEAIGLEYTHRNEEEERAREAAAEINRTI